MKYILVIVFCFLNPFQIVAQNLVPNPSFEDTLSCPQGLNVAILSCKDWYCTVPYLTSDYMNACTSMEDWCGVPNNHWGHQYARTGNAYCGFAMAVYNPWPFDSFYAEYISVELTSPLEAGELYEYKMYLNLTDSSRFTTSSIGVLFTTNPYSHSEEAGNSILANPQLSNPAHMFIPDTVGWYCFHQFFVADSNYRYITIGNFNNYANTPIISMGGPNDPYGIYPSPYFFIDDVSLRKAVAVFDTICVGQNATLTSQGDTYVAWANSLSPDEIISQDSILIVSPAINSVYYNYSKTDTIAYVVIVTLHQDVYLGADTNLCANDVLTLDATNSYATYFWQDSSTLPVYEVTEAGTYWAEVSNKCGVFNDTINISYNALPVHLGNDTALCAGQHLLLNPNVNMEGVSYLWQNNSTNSTYYVPWSQTPAYFYVEVRNSDFCGRDTIYIDSPSDFGEILLDDFTALCEGNSVDVEYSGIEADSYLWSNGSTGTSIVVYVPGTYWLQLTNHCYTRTDTIIALLKPTPFFELGEDLVLCYNETITLEINTMLSAIKWWEKPESTTPIVANEEGNYIAVASYQGCIYRDSIYISYEDCSIVLDIPNVFTPNGDGRNDYFLIQGRNVIDYHLSVIDRWGKMVFQSDAILHSWNGKSQNGNKCNSGIYFYVITVKNERDSRVYTGTVTLSE